MVSTRHFRHLSPSNPVATSTPILQTGGLSTEGAHARGGDPSPPHTTHRSHHVAPSAPAAASRALAGLPGMGVEDLHPAKPSEETPAPSDSLTTTSGGPKTHGSATLGSDHRDHTG